MDPESVSRTTLEIASRQSLDSLALKDYTFAACVTLLITTLVTAHRRNPENQKLLRLKFFHHHLKSPIRLKQLIFPSSQLVPILVLMFPIVVMVGEAMDYA
jgi:hypothetical protein